MPWAKPSPRAHPIVTSMASSAGSDRGSPGCSSGLGVGLLPARLCRQLLSSENPVTHLLALGFAGLGLPYILAALLMTFVHDDSLAAKPASVLVALFQLGSSFLFLLRVRRGPGRRRRRHFRIGVSAPAELLQNVHIRMCAVLGILRLDHNRRDANPGKPLPSTPKSTRMEPRPPALGPLSGNYEPMKQTKPTTDHRGVLSTMLLHGEGTSRNSNAISVAKR